MTVVSRMFIASAIGAAIFAAACGGGSSKSATSTPEAAASPGASASAARGTPPGLSTPVAAATTASGQTGTTLTAEQAKTLLDNASLTPKDLPTGWTVMADTVQGNALAASADPSHA